MSTATIKHQNIHFRVSSKTKSLIDRALLVSGRSLTEFATNSLEGAANEVLEREYTTILSDRDRDVILALLDADSEPTEALREAARLHRESIIE